ncbi:MAG: helix-turn-helix domain-containing protein [Anaerorhabdus sp.]
MFNENLKRLINQKYPEMSQQQLAEHLGVTQEAIVRWENGTGFPGPNNLTKLAEFLQVSKEELLQENTNSLKNDPRFKEFKFAVSGSEDGLSEEQMEDLLNYYEYIKTLKK